MSAENTRCPACGREVTPATDGSQVLCPQCGTSVPPLLPGSGLKWWRLLIVLLIPPVLTLLSSAARVEPLIFIFPIFGSIFAGILCGVMLGKHLGKTPGMRVLLGFVFVGLFGLTSFILSFCGCLAGGFAMNFH